MYELIDFIMWNDPHLGWQYEICGFLLASSHSLGRVYEMTPLQKDNRPSGAKIVEDKLQSVRYDSMI